MRVPERGLARRVLAVCAAATLWAALNMAATAQIRWGESSPTVPPSEMSLELRLDPLPQPLRKHGCVLAGDRLYGIGGSLGPATEARTTDQVWSMKVENGGRLGAVRTEKSLPRPLTGLGRACAVWNDRVIYVAGGAGSGLDGPPCSNRVLIGQLGKDGAISDWRESVAWPGPGVTDAAVAIADSYLFLTGGQDGAGQGRSEMYRARIGNAGELLEWSKESELPEPRTSHGVFCDAGRLYVLGGRAGRDQAARMTIFSADLGTSATAQRWDESLAPMLHAVADGATATAGHRFYWIGGVNAFGQPFPNLMFGRSRGGRWGQWQVVPLELPAARDIGAAIDPLGRRLYITGGSLSTNLAEPSRDVRVAALTIGAFDRETTATSVIAGAPDAASAEGGPKVVTLEVTPPSERKTPFLPEAEAFRLAREHNRPTLLVVYSSSDPESLKVYEGLLRNRRFEALMAGIALGSVDLAKDPAARARLQADKLPLFLVYDDKGELRRRDTSARTLKDFMAITADVQ